MLTVSGLNSWYGRAQTLFGVDLSVGSGEVVALLGRNGAGKSTTFRSILGLIPEVRGDIRFKGAELTGLPTHEIVRLGIGYVPEDRRIFTDLTVAENLIVGTQASRQGAPYWTKEALFALFPNLATMQNRLAGRMSGGEQQMLTIARTLMGNPALVLLDEPSEGLAPKIVDDMADALLTMKRQGLAILLAEQSWHFAETLADRAYVMERGAIRFEGTLAELNASPEIRDRYLAI
jgi:branched-chain amino acid transport system ATP-binding protein